MAKQKRKTKEPEVVIRVPPSVSAERLLDFYGIPKKGDEFDYEEIAEIINEEYHPYPCPWYYITAYWRKWLLREHDLVIKPKQYGSKKFRCLGDSETVNFVSNRWDHIEEIGKKATKELKTVDPKKLTPKETYRLNVEIIKFHHIKVAKQRKFTMKEAAKLARESTRTVSSRPMLVPILPDSKVSRDETG